MSSNNLKKQSIKEFLNSGSPAATATNIVIVLIALGLITYVIAVAPALFVVSRQFKTSKRYSKKQMVRAYENARRRGFIEITKNSKEFSTIALTQKGQNRLDIIVLDTIDIPIPRRWDGKWRFVIFDIPKEKAKVRDEFRFKLKDLGLKQYQGSVWIHPYPCENEVKLVATFFTIRKHVDVLEVINFLGESKMKRSFTRECGV